MVFDEKRMLNKPSFDSTLEEKVYCLGRNLEYCIGVAGSGDDTCPTGDFEIAVEVIKLIPTLFDKIAHGEEGHRQWLKEAIEAHFLGLPMPEYKAK